MCRWMAYTGKPVLLEELIFKAEHNLIDQSMSSRSAETPTNGDGFGLGWYGRREFPGLFRSLRPAWNDFNLRDLAGQIETHLFFMHVRATSLATVQETNCHPFRYGRWLFVHNGEIFEVEKLRRKLLFAVAPELFPQVLGTTDSEVMFYLALTFGLESDPLGALARMAGFVEKVGREEGISETLWMTLGVSDGETVYGVRYASDNDAPTLYHSRDMDEVYELNPALRGRLAATTRIVVSEPIGQYAEAWVPVPQNTSIAVRGGEIVARPFVPVAP